MYSLELCFHELCILLGCSSYKESLVIDTTVKLVTQFKKTSENGKRGSRNFNEKEAQSQLLLQCWYKNHNQTQQSCKSLETPAIACCTEWNAKPLWERPLFPPKAIHPQAAFLRFTSS